LHPDLHWTERENNVIHDIVECAALNVSAPSRRFAMRVSDADYATAFRQLILSLLWPNVRNPAPSRLLAFSGITPSTAEYLTKLFPQMKLVLIVRNGIEVVASRMRYDGFKHAPFESHAATWKSTAELAEWGRTRNDFMLVRHEQMISAAGATSSMSRLFEFLGLRPHAACVQHLCQKYYHPTPDTPSTVAKPQARDGLQHRVERWHKWSEPQLRAFTEHCASAMAYFGYDLPWQTGAQTQTELKPAAGVESDLRVAS
jgi:hypothetical protein